jgi:hypothetical protein
MELVVPGNPAAQGAPAEEQQQQEGHDVNSEDEDDEEYSPLSDIEGEKVYRDTEEMESFRAEARVSTGRLWALLGHLGITSTPRYRVKGVPCPRREEIKAAVENFSRYKVLYRHQGPAFRASISDVVAHAASQAITSWSCRKKDELQNSVHRFLPQWKKDKFMASRVKKDVPMMKMVHHQDVTVEWSVMSHP